MPSRRTSRVEAIVLDNTKLAEQDLIVTLLSSTGEQLRAVAKGARKPGARLAARTGLFLDIDALLSHGRGLPLLTEAQIVHDAQDVGTDLDRVACASALCEVARLTCYEGVQDPFLHPLLLRALRAVGEAQDGATLSVVAAAYTLKVLSHAGWRPELDGCVMCGETPTSRISVLAGGAICESCARDVAGAEPIVQNQLAWTRALIGATFDTLCEASVDPSTANYLLWFAHSWAQTHLDTRLRAFEFFSTYGTLV